MTIKYELLKYYKEIKRCKKCKKFYGYDPPKTKINTDPENGICPLCINYSNRGQKGKYKRKVFSKFEQQVAEQYLKSQGLWPLRDPKTKEDNR